MDWFLYEKDLRRERVKIHEKIQLVITIFNGTNFKDAKDFKVGITTIKITGDFQTKLKLFRQFLHLSGKLD